MADGQIPYSNAGNYPQSCTNAVLNALMLLLDGATTTDHSVWTQNYPFSKQTIEVVASGTSPTFSIQMCGSNSLAAPANSNDGSALGSAITTIGMTATTYSPRWIKAKLSSISGTNAQVSVTVNATT